MKAPEQAAPVQETMGEDIFQGQSKIMIKQEFAALELCSIEAKNRYRVSVPQGENEGGNIFLYVDEESGCCERICCSKNRTLTQIVHKGSSKDGPVAMSMHKPFHCQGCCCMRPSFMLYDGPKDSSRQIGTVKDPCRCCVMDQQILDSKDQLVYTTNGSICQCGMCCPCCGSVDFNIRKEGTDVGLISKRPMTCGECLKKTNRFIIDFPPDANPDQKKMIFGAAMLLDLQYFEEKENKNGGQS